MANELILIVEDNEKNRRLARDVLQFNGYRIAESDNAEDGVRLAKEQKPALILMDFHLPGMNGIEALKVLRADDDTKSIPAIAFTASAMTEDRQKILQAGFEGLQTKPIHVKEFVQAIKDVLARKAGA
jgi:two-component system cell cycle response regulator DivK